MVQYDGNVVGDSNSGINGVKEHRFSADFVEDFGFGRFHSRSLPRGKDDNADGHAKAFFMSETIAVIVIVIISN